MESLGIAIDGGRYVRFLQGERGRIHRVRLCPLRPYQQQAQLQIVDFQKERIQSRKTLLIPLNSQERNSDIHLQIQKNWSGWHGEVHVTNGSTLPIHLYSSSFWFTLFLLGVLFLLIGAGTWGLSQWAARSPSILVTTSEQSAENALSSSLSDVVDFPETDGSISSAEKTGNPSALAQALMQGTQKEDLPEPSSPMVSEDLFNHVVYFDAERFDLIHSEKELLRSWASSLPQDSLVEIEGHCANYGTERGRTELSQQRADMVESWLMQYFPQIQIHQVEAFGSSRPSSIGDGSPDWDRRVELLLSHGEQALID
ncbi:MAG: OmpA family protein [Spirochaetales bacterium]|nr:OmpA family protein [Spirochaetales bacterium]